MNMTWGKDARAPEKRLINNFFKPGLFFILSGKPGLDILERYSNLLLFHDQAFIIKRPRSFVILFISK